MSRIGKAPIPVPSGVTVDIKGSDVSVKGPKGQLHRTVRPEVKLKQEDGKILVERTADTRDVRSLHGLTRTLVANMVKGVTDGFTQNLEIVGVGYRAVMEGRKLVSSLATRTLSKSSHHKVWKSQSVKVTFSPYLVSTSKPLATCPHSSDRSVRLKSTRARV